MPAGRCRAKREQVEWLKDSCMEADSSQDQNLTPTVLCVPDSLDGGGVTAEGSHFEARQLTETHELGTRAVTSLERVCTRERADQSTAST